MKNPEIKHSAEKILVIGGDAISSTEPKSPLINQETEKAKGLMLKDLVNHESLMKIMLSNCNATKSQSNFSKLANKLTEMSRKYIDVINEHLELSLFKWKIDARAWHMLFYPCLTVFRNNTSHLANSEFVIVYYNVLDCLYSFYAKAILIINTSLKRQIDVVTTLTGRWLIKLGDICRYRIDILDNGQHKCGKHCDDIYFIQMIDSQQIPYIPQQLDKENLSPSCQLSKYFYYQASLLMPDSGKPYHKLAILSIRRQENVLSTLYYLYHSIIGYRRDKIKEINSNKTNIATATHEEPELSVKNILESIYKRNNKALMRVTERLTKNEPMNEEICKEMFTLNIVQCHWHLYTGIDLDLVKSLCDQLKQLSSDFNIIDVITQSLGICSDVCFPQRSLPYLNNLISLLKSIEKNYLHANEVTIDNDENDREIDNLSKSLSNSSFKEHFTTNDKQNKSIRPYDAKQENKHNNNMDLMQAPTSDDNNDTVVDPLHKEITNELDQLSVAEIEKMDAETLKLILLRNKLRKENCANPQPTQINQKTKDYNQNILAVFDTNTLMGNLTNVDKIYRNCNVIIPEVVESELRKLNRRRSGNDVIAIRAERGLNWLKSNQHELVKNYRDEQSNDDKIIESSVNLNETSSEDNLIVLVTDDKILSIKAIQKGVHCCSTRELIKNLRKYRISYYM